MVFAFIRPSTLAISAAVLTSAVTSFAAGQSTLSVSGSATVSHVATSTNREFTVNVNVADLSANAVGAQATIAYDPLLVEFVNVAAGDDLGFLIYSSHDTAGAKVFFATGVDPVNPTAGMASGNVAKLTFRAIAGTCSDTDVVTFATGSVPTRVTDVNGNSLSFTESNAVTVTALGAFTLAGVPSNRTSPADAGTVDGSLQSFTSPTASDSCGTALTVNFSRSDSAASTAYYPVGATTITWSATDAAGNSDSGQTVMTVSNYQLLDAAVDLVGTVTGNSTRSIRIKAGASNQVVSVAMTGTYGLAADVQVPVAAGYACMSAKDTVHSLTDIAQATVVGVEYSADFDLKQGDSNNDDLVDILDFGIYVGDFGAAVEDGVSNFNADLLVNNADFGFISVNFLQAGQACGAYTAGTPRTRVSVKQLRRAGLGHLASADLTRDGWVDMADVAHYMQFGIPSQVQGTNASGNVAW